ncbi:MAG: DNA mismatch repair endonuclease MutL [Treponema sp.]|jgi:DNA mismatch repair protein MutL|nr:DNA mismatch repair endonuclease MutL [Treponema sp.]
MIKVLPPEEARKIAAGEVIDRPAALIREFLDNAIDADSGLIEVFIEGGGSVKAEVIDDGGGMNREDLALCILPHATSKISSLDDLAFSHTLGFRGEALAAVAAAAKLEIVTSTDGLEAWKLEAGGGHHTQTIIQTSRTKGTSARAFGLFDSIPARKRFLKRERSEGNLCRQMFLEKALAFPDRNFRFTADGNLKDFYPAAADLKERFTAAMLSGTEANFLHEIHFAGTGFSGTIVIGGPELYRGDRRLLYTFANGRRINDWGLLQALEFGSQGWFPNGTHPIGAVYIDVDPGLADFNIHPAKREVRFADPGTIHHGITSALIDFVRHYAVKAGSGRPPFREADSGPRLALEALPEKTPAFAFTPPPASKPLYGAADAADTAAEEAPSYGETREPGQEHSRPPPAGRPRYAGRAFGLFILVEWGEKLFIIDQHAAHERVLYDKMLSCPIPKQELLVPIPFETESDEDDRFLEGHKEDLAKLAVLIEKDKKGWRIEALPSDWRLTDKETVQAILDLKNSKEDITKRWAATLCCRGAIKDGDYLDNASAMALAEEAFNLSDPHCPHGRPIWTEISREALYKAVKRI